MKIPLLRIMLSFLIPLVFLQCKSFEVLDANNPTIAKFKLKKGMYDQSFSIENSPNWSIKLSIPEIVQGKKMPLILALHWAGNLSTYQEFADCLAFPGLDTLGGIIVAPSSNGLSWDQPINEKRIIQLINEIKKYWPISEKQIIVTGYSNGGIGSWFFVKKYPELFAAAIPMAGYYRPLKLKVPIFVIHGKKDELFMVEEVENAVDLSRKNGSKIYLEILEDYSHYMGCSYTEALQRIGLRVQKELF